LTALPFPGWPPRFRLFVVIYVRLRRFAAICVSLDPVLPNLRRLTSVLFGRTSTGIGRCCRLLVIDEAHDRTPLRQPGSRCAQADRTRIRHRAGAARPHLYRDDQLSQHPESRGSPTSSASPSPIIYIIYIPPRYGAELTRLLVTKGIHCTQHRSAPGFYR
jgi:hypothetical protein